MIRKELLESLERMMPEEEIPWMIDLGYQFTVYARGAYPLDEQPGNLNHLLGFNEMQHQIYGRVRHLRRGEEWTLQSFLEGLSERAETYGIAGDLDAAVKASLAFKPPPGRIQ